MPDKHSNNKPQVSEELIRQYLAGELDDKAMHALERQALDDPFLAEALEGYAAHEPDQSAQLAELQQRLEQRVGLAEKGRLRQQYYRWASAAAILVILGVSFLWINRQQLAERNKEIAKTEETRPAIRSDNHKATDSTKQAPAIPDAATPAGSLALGRKASPAGEKKLKKDLPHATLKATETADTPLAAWAEDIRPLERRDSISAGISANADLAVGEKALAPPQQPVPIKIRGISTMQQALEGKAAGVDLYSNSNYFFNGRVVDKESGEPLPGVTVLANNKGVMTDRNGAFSISLDSTESPTLKLAAIGYNSRHLSLRGHQNNVTVAMEPTNTALGEVVVVGYGAKARRPKFRNNNRQQQYAQNIVVLGSSTAAGTGPKTSDSAWVNLLRKYLQLRDTAIVVTNLAVGGFTSYKILPEGEDIPFYKPKPDPEHNIDRALSLRPDLIIINMPSNDVTEGFSVEDFRRNLETVTDLIREQRIRFYITTTQPRNTTADNRKKLQQMRDIIIRSYRRNYIDCWDGLSTPDGNILPQYDSGDGVHLNGLGHRILFERVKQKIL